MSKGDLERFPERPAMRQALAAASAEKRKPTEADRPPLSTFPKTRAARAALAMWRKRPGA